MLYGKLSHESRNQDADLVGVRQFVGFGEGAVDGAALVEDEAAHGDGAQGEPEEALLRADPDPDQQENEPNQPQ